MYIKSMIVIYIFSIHLYSCMHIDREYIISVYDMYRDQEGIKTSTAP